jgi:hypothetical protein
MMHAMEFMVRKAKLSALFTVLLAGCQKDEVIPAPTPAPVPAPAIRYTDLGNTPIFNMYGKSIDIDGDATNDFYFQALPVGDPVLGRERLQFYAYSKIHSSLLNDAVDQSPMLDHSALITTSFTGYTWYEISAVVLAEEIRPDNAASYWEGSFKNASHKYLPVRIQRNNLYYFGWIELSMDKENRKLILHRAGMSTEAGKEIKAGS